MRFSLSLAVLAAVTATVSAAERVVTANFEVTAPTKDLARKFADGAEYYRKEKAMEWLGKEMPNWPQRCPLEVIVNPGAAGGGATTFDFEQDNSGRMFVAKQFMEIKGDARQLMDSVLPHEITHTVFAYHFGRPVPRWADEGGSVLSENDEERFKHDVSAREILNQGRGIKLRVLFAMKKYPRDMIVTYAEGYSVVDFLVEKGGRKKFLEFVGTGMKNDQRNWDEACQTLYGYKTVEALEEAWIQSLYKPPATVAARNSGSGAKGNTVASGTSRPRTEVRVSGGNGVGVLEAPIVARGSTPENERPRPNAGQPFRPTTPPPVPLLLPPEQVRK